MLYQARSTCFAQARKTECRMHQVMVISIYLTHIFNLQEKEKMIPSFHTHELYEHELTGTVHTPIVLIPNVEITNG